MVVVDGGRLAGNGVTVNSELNAGEWVSTFLSSVQRWIVETFDSKLALLVSRTSVRDSRL